MMDVSEKNFEATIEDSLLDQGYTQHSTQDYDQHRCLIPDDLFDFIIATQPEEWERFKNQHGSEAKSRLLRRLTKQINKKGTIDVLRTGISTSGCRFDLAYFVPETGLNPEHQRKYEANRFTIVRQLHYSARSNKSLDLVIFLNGLPIFTAELKNQFTNQTVEDAIRQYRYDRDPRGEPLFDFGRVLAHFAVDTELVYYTTELRGRSTHFLPFNKGYGTGAGNPPSATDFATAYLWEEIWAPNSVLNLVKHFIHTIVEEDEEGHKETRLIFPRYHQINAVRRLIGDVRETGAGEQYLIQHSAGSGKSFSIAWLAHQLAGLHDDEDERIFHSVVVVTDRRVLDQQIQETVQQFEQTLGLVAAIDQDSQQLKRALESGKQIIVSTLQKFPFIVEEIGRLAGSRFAVIVDEAHSSQTGETAKSLKEVLVADSLEAAEAEEADADEQDMEEYIARQMRVRGRLPNVSFFAFTATPKGKTLELFGTKQADGSYAPFSLYSMRQAIEEGFIMDVLENYTTYTSYFHLLKTVEDDPRFDRSQATTLLKRFVDLHEHSIRQKVEIMIEHFVRHVQDRIDGRAKAMIVTRSRLHCVRYKRAVDTYIKERGYGFEALVAFSGTVKDGGLEYTERSMNGFPDSRTADQFKKKDRYRIMVVANKFQTGFDVPVLHTMYVDKKLGGVNAVQTLSRLNRTHPDKEETMVLDFVNEAEGIQQAFAPYYEKTLLSEGTDPDQLYDLQDTLLGYHFFDLTDVETFAEIYFAPGATQDTLHPVLAPAVERYKAATEERQADFRSHLRDYVRRYAFLAQVVTFADAELEKFYQYCRFLRRKLPVSKERLPVEVQQAVDMDSYRIQRTSSGSISLPRGEGVVNSLHEAGAGYRVKEEEPLSRIIRELNDRFGTEFTDEDKVRVVVEQLESSLRKNDALKKSVETNPPEKARLSFEHVISDEMQDVIDTNFKFYRKFTDDPDFAEYFLGWMFDRYMQEHGRRPGHK